MTPYFLLYVIRNKPLLKLVKIKSKNEQEKTFDFGFNKTRG